MITNNAYKWTNINILCQIVLLNKDFRHIVAPNSWAILFESVTDISNSISNFSYFNLFFSQLEEKLSPWNLNLTSASVDPFFLTQIFLRSGLSFAFFEQQPLHCYLSYCLAPS